MRTISRRRALSGAIVAQGGRTGPSNPGLTRNRFGITRVRLGSHPMRVSFGWCTGTRSSQSRVKRSAFSKPRARPPSTFRRRTFGGNCCRKRGGPRSANGRDRRRIGCCTSGGHEIDQAAWSYEEPFVDFVAIRGYLGFYPSKLECHVGEHRVTPQPGGFYGGWVTPDVVGPFKGEPGTGAW